MLWQSRIQKSLYKGEGIFIAGGAGVTPFIAIFRDLHEQGKTENQIYNLNNR
jgi:hypothetical protein